MAIQTIMSYSANPTTTPFNITLKASIINSTHFSIMFSASHYTTLTSDLLVGWVWFDQTALSADPTLVISAGSIAAADSRYEDLALGTPAPMNLAIGFIAGSFEPFDILTFNFSTATLQCDGTRGSFVRLEFAYVSVRVLSCPSSFPTLNQTDQRCYDSSGDNTTNQTIRCTWPTQLVGGSCERGSALVPFLSFAGVTLLIFTISLFTGSSNGV